MKAVYRCCCGIDVHKKLIVACLKKGGRQEMREFGTMTGEIKELTKWLKEAGCEMAAMESTGVYWKPLYNLFELMGLDVMVVNAAHMKAVPGRKTDIKDAEWIVELLQHGLLKASFIPSREQRELRELTRYRKSLTEECSRELSRLQKVLEGANVKLASVVGDIQGKSARRLLDRLAAGDPLGREDILPLLYKTLQPKLDDITSSLESITTPLQRALLRQILDHIDDLDRRVAVLDGMVEQYMAEIGLDMGRFPSAAHLCSWAGVSPGNHQSAGKRKHGRTNKGNKTLKSMLAQCAKAARKVKNSYFYAQYQRIAARRGKNRATIAVAHSILTVIWHMLKHNLPYRDLGADYYDGFHREHKIKAYLKRLQALGWEPEPPAVSP